jgi:hypothetical protein
MGAPPIALMPYRLEGSLSDMHESYLPAETVYQEVLGRWLGTAAQ